jgi:hypothetical protein
MNKSNDLLNLEKKLENNSSQELILNRFKINKPEIGTSKINPNLFNNVSSFIEKFKVANDELLNNPDKLEQASIEANLNKYNTKYIEMNLGLGVLDVNPKEDMYDSVINNLNGNNNYPYWCNHEITDYRKFLNVYFQFQVLFDEIKNVPLNFEKF